MLLMSLVEQYMCGLSLWWAKVGSMVKSRGSALDLLILKARSHILQCRYSVLRFFVVCVHVVRFLSAAFQARRTLCGTMKIFMCLITDSIHSTMLSCFRQSRVTTKLTAGM